MAEVLSVDVPASKKEPATIEVSTTAATGDGPLTAEASNEESECFEVKVEELEDQKFKLTFNPPSPAEYSLSIKWGDQPIEGSPLKLNLNAANSKAVIISEPPGANIRPGQKITIGFDASKAGRGSLTSTCSADDTGEIPVEVVRKGQELNSEYTVSFLPPHEDLYILHVKWAGKNVKGSPFHIDMIPVLPSKVVASDFVVPKEPGGKIELNVCTKGAGNAKLQATCKGERAGDIPVEINKLSSNDYHLTATTMNEPDKYTVDVTFAGHAIPNSPFVADCVPSARSVEHLATILPDTDDCPVILKFDTCKAGEGNMRARVAYTAYAGTIDYKCEQLPDADHLYQVTFVPPRADLYLVDVYWNDSEVPGSPFGVAIHKPDKLVFSEVKYPDIDGPVELDVDASEAGPGKLTASCKGEKTGDIDVYIEEAEPGSRKYAISYRRADYDTYTLTVYFNGEKVREFMEELKLDIEKLPPVDKPGCFLFGVSSRKQFFVGEKITFGVDATNAQEGRLNVTVAGPSIDKDPPVVHVESSEDKPRVYNIECIPNALGEHKIQLKWDDDLIPNSPVVFTVEDAEDIPTFPLTKPYKIYFVTDCDPKDIRSFGVHEESETSKDLIIGERRNRKVKLTYNAEQPGIHTLHVLINDSEIQGSPYRVRFVKSDPKACKLLDVPDTAYVGEEASFIVDARKAGTGELHVRARVPVGGSGITTRHELDKDGFYTIFFAAKVPGDHFFDLSWAGEPIFESPVKIAIEQREVDLQTAKEEASKVHVLREDHYIFDVILPYGLPAFICINAKEAGKGKLSLKTTGPGEAKTSVIDRGSGMYTAEIRPTVAGVYTLGIYWNDLHIKGSPFTLHFTKEKSYLINELDLESVPFLVNVPYTFNLHCPQDEKRELSITCTPTTAATITCKPFESDENSYVCEIVPKEEGNHEISIKYDGCDVHNSPHNVQFDQNPDSTVEDSDFAPLDISIDMGAALSPKESVPSDPVPNEVRAFGPGLSDGLVIGQEGFFTIETEKAGEGKLEVDVYGPKGAFKINLRRHPENIRTLLARYDPKVVGKYTIDILWDGEHISQSPFSVYVSDQKLVENLAKVDMTIEL